jgi:hypothetical protein
MRYFTPELYLRFNCSDRAEVAKAHAEWEDAIEAYREHLEEIGPKLMANVRNLAQTLCLHDADYLGMAVMPTPDAGKPLAVLLIRQNRARLFLVYYLAEQPTTREIAREWPFSKKQVHWLYDEFDADEEGIQQHEVLLSNGQVLNLRFHEMQVIKHDIEEPALAAQR